MSTTLPKTDLVRMAWIAALRQEGDRQCSYIHERGRQVCAFALLAEMSGGRTNEWASAWQLAGLSEEQAVTVVCMNDGGTHMDTNISYRKHTFSEIADVVESWFSKRV